MSSERVSFFAMVMGVGMIVFGGYVLKKRSYRNCGKMPSTSMVKIVNASARLKHVGRISGSVIRQAPSAAMRIAGLFLNGVPALFLLVLALQIAMR